MPERRTDSGGPSSLYNAEHRNVGSISSNSRPSTATRPTSYTPSYMSIIARKPPPVESMRSAPVDMLSTPTSSSANAAENAAEMPTNEQLCDHPGALVVLAASQLHPSILSCLAMLLKKQNFATIVIAAATDQEAALKQLKMDVYALIGQLRREIGVVTVAKEKWTQVEIEAVLQEATKTTSGLQGVLCCPAFGEASSDTEVFSLEEEDMQHSWTSSVGFLHTAAKVTKDHLLSQCKPGSNTTNRLGRIPHGPFFIVAAPSTYSPVSQIAKAACDTLILQLARATKTQRLTVGYADDTLVPEPKKEQEPDGNGARTLQPTTYTTEDAAFAPESPTKLWNMWALQEDVGIRAD